MTIGWSSKTCFSCFNEDHSRPFSCFSVFGLQTSSYSEFFPYFHLGLAPKRILTLTHFPPTSKTRVPFHRNVSASAAAPLGCHSNRRQVQRTKRNESETLRNVAHRHGSSSNSAELRPRRPHQVGPSKFQRPGGGGLHWEWSPKLSIWCIHHHLSHLLSTFRACSVLTPPGKTKKGWAR